MADGGVGLGVELVPDVLVEGTAVGDVEHLRAAADAEERDVSLHAAAHEEELDGVLLVVHGGVAWVKAPHGLELLQREHVASIIAVAAGVIEGGVDVLALAEEHAVDGLVGIEHGVHYLVFLMAQRTHHRRRRVGAHEVFVEMPNTERGEEEEEDWCGHAGPTCNNDQNRV
ncbi:unnamed protein product [Triticum turgidum subsp. durum]|uniref:Uncharacterized protein n=1 Tax=Triticum turgidum subsp. durum TaxID=4567 RepID=A0A9R1NI49_TRITD|nr:unnamed protein product [Triticum turgidum subsp. durum]